MKISINYKTLIVVLTLSISFFSCKKENMTVPITVSGLSLIHASPTAEKLDVYVDNIKINATDFSYGTKIDYVNAYTGNRNLILTKKGSSTPLKTELFILEPQIGFSLFVFDKIENVKFLLIRDDLTKPPAGAARVRFVNISPDADALDMSISGQSAALFTNIAFKQYTTFVNITKGDKITFNIKDKATGALETALVDVKIEEGQIYTIYVRGLKSATDETKFGATIFTHK